MKEILQEFGAHYQKHLKHAWNVPLTKAKNLRVSSFPYCGLRHWYMNLLEVSGELNFSSAYYTSVGTLVHALVQGWIGEGGRIYGNWKCVQKGCGGKRYFSHSKRCPKCKLPMEYEEFAVRAFKYLSGHIDGLYRSADGRWWIIDYKTCSVRIISTNGQTGMLPYKANEWQIKAYCALIEMILNIEVSGWILHYVARDDPITCHVATGGMITKKEKARYMKKMETWDRHFGVVNNVTKLSDIKVLVEEKPCKTEEFYNMEYKKIDTCPLAMGGRCFDPDKLRAHLKEVWNEFK